MFFVSLYFQLLVKGASERGAKRIRLHILTDGRDVLDGSSVGFVEALENKLEFLISSTRRVLMHGLHLVVEGCLLPWTAMKYTHLIQSSAFVV